MPNFLKNNNNSIEDNSFDFFIKHKNEYLPYV